MVEKQLYQIDIIDGNSRLLITLRQDMARNFLKDEEVLLDMVIV